jgi:GntR family transcriptional regulator/MocR family aminotransferase
LELDGEVLTGGFDVDLHAHTVRRCGSIDEATLRTRRGPLFEAHSDAGAPRYRQIYRQIRDAILERRLQAGERLPSSRTFAAESAIARKTVEEAYAQLEGEGYIVRRAGSGSFVAEIASVERKRGDVRLAGRRALSKRGRGIAATTACVEPTSVRAFAAGLPALDAFPIELWQRLVARHARRIDLSSLVYADPAGLPALREAIAAYLGHARGVRCDASQVVIVSSSQQALDLIARLTIDPDDEAWIENPSYPGARAALVASGAKLVPVRVDDDGLDVAHGIEQSARARVAYVTPSHQYPLGKTMSLERRLALLDWARRAEAWVVEDDYDSEFRYDGRPVPAIQGLDSAGRVIYVGTFTKVLYPSLRLAYLVLPSDLVQSFVNARTQIDGLRRRSCRAWSRSSFAKDISARMCDACARSTVRVVTCCSKPRRSISARSSFRCFTRDCARPVSFAIAAMMSSRRATRIGRGSMRHRSRATT